MEDRLTMRRKDREIKDAKELEEILRKADVCRIAFAVNGIPYIVTMNFGYVWKDNLILYFHCAKEGRKLELMKSNNTVCFEMDIDHKIVEAVNTCDWGMKYRSIVGLGLLESVAEETEKKKGLDCIMDHYGFDGKKEYDGKVLHATERLRLTVTEFSGKKKQ
jgi:nitroimidazol reductase NimA-like FMN-containing flavoprotein (pyridoxamine 5'-phosphate oxidase superfamily)